MTSPAPGSLSQERELDSGDDFYLPEGSSNEPVVPFSEGVRKRVTFCDASQARPRITSSYAERLRSRSTTGRLSTMLVPQRKVGKAPGFRGSLMKILRASWLNIFLLCIPASWALNFAFKWKDRDTALFVVSFVAIIPLAKLLGLATKELSIRVGEILAGFLSATLGNAVELIVAIVALTKCELRVVQTSLVGSILSNLLFVLGICFFAGGLRYSEQGFGLSAARLDCSLLTIGIIAVLLPNAFFNYGFGTVPRTTYDVLAFSHGVAIILLFVYCAYLIFQLYSHTTLYGDHSMDISPTVRYSLHRPNIIKYVVRKTSKNDNNSVDVGHQEFALNPESSITEDEDEDEEIPDMNVPVSLGLLVVVTVLIAVTAEFLVDSIDGLIKGGQISREFVGIILLPIIGHAAKFPELLSTITVSVKDKLILSLRAAVGSSIQLALFVIPFVVTLAWILQKPLTLLFDLYESIAIFLAVVAVNCVVQDGKSNWLEGLILICLYMILAVTFWYYPGSDTFFCT